MTSYNFSRDFYALHNSQEIPEGLKKGFDQNWLGLTCLQIIQIISKNYEKIQRGQRSSLELRKNIYKGWAQDFLQEVFDWSEIEILILISIILLQELQKKGSRTKR